jgi:hypothetical protein
LIQPLLTYGFPGNWISDKRMENFENERILDDFREYLIVERQLSKRTVERHVSEINKVV